MWEQVKEVLQGTAGCLMTLLGMGISLFISGASIVVSVVVFLWVMNLCCG